MWALVGGSLLYLAVLLVPLLSLAGAAFFSYSDFEMRKPAFGEIHRKILDLLKKNPGGISEGRMRKTLHIKPDKQTQFGRRRRELHYRYRIDKKYVGREVLYIYRGERKRPRDSSAIDEKTRAMVLHLAHGRCGMCGRTVEKHGIALVIDHKIPRHWGGKTEPANLLWALCEECNRGKKNLFKSVDSPAMRKAMSHASVHMRIGEFLKASGVGKAVPSHFIDIVANQDEWRKRLRELRYLKWEITASRAKLPGNRFQSAYRLDKFTDWPPDPTGWIRAYEQRRANRNRTVKRPRPK